MNDNWYEKGELPPVGSVVEVIGCVGEEMKKWNGESVKVVSHEKPTGLDGYVPVVFHPELGATTIMPNKIKPLRTETDKLVEQMERSFESTGCVFTNDHRALAEHLIDNDWRPVKQQSEDEFVDQSGLDDDSGRILYRAGCRFIEQVEV